MSKDKLQLLSPLFLKYQSDFEKNPRSRVFAPLAEAYRKLGMTEKAMEILSQGIRFHPTYTMGYLGLAFCYFDIKQFNLAYSTLRPLVENNRDNIRLQKLFADICLEMGKLEEALETLKYLLFVNPRDKEVGEKVTTLEKQIEDRYKPTHKPIIIPEDEFGGDHLFDLNKLEKKISEDKSDYDNWMTVDLSHEAKVEDHKLPAETKITSASNFDQWNVKKSEDVHERLYQVHLDLDEDAQLDEEPEELAYEKFVPKTESAPLVTHTLVDLYCGQGHMDKALEVLEKILLLNPNDQKTINKIQEIKSLIEPQVLGKTHEEERSLHLVDLSELKETTEEDGRRHLMSLIDEKIGPVEVKEDQSKIEAVREIEEKLTLFLKKIQQRALDYQARL